MDKNKLIIIGLIIIIIALLIGIFLSLQPTKEDTKIIIIGNSTMNGGEYIVFKLFDSNNVPITNQTLNATITCNGNTSSYPIITDNNGSYKFTLNDFDGNITINVTFNGNENYSGNNTIKNIFVIKNVAQSSYQSVSSGNDEPEYGTDEYVDKWDQSLRGDGSWAYTHDQPVKKDKHGNEYKRMYDPETHENYWYNMGKRDWIVD